MKQFYAAQLKRASTKREKEVAKAAAGLDEVTSKMYELLRQGKLLDPSKDVDTAGGTDSEHILELIRTRPMRLGVHGIEHPEGKTGIFTVTQFSDAELVEATKYLAAINALPKPKGK